MGVVIIKPRAVIRQVLTEPTNRLHLDCHHLVLVDALLDDADDNWTDHEYGFLELCMRLIDRAVK